MTSKLDAADAVTRVAANVTTSAPREPAAERRRQPPPWRRHLAFTNIGVVYVWIGVMIVFSLWAPDTFPTWATVKSVLNQNAISGLIALALVVPLSARVFDLSVGNAVGLSNILVAWLLIDKGVAVVPAIILTVAAGLAIGLVNAFVVVGARIDSFIGTLATGSLLAAASSLISKDQPIIGPALGGSFGKIATTNVAGIQLPVFFLLLVAVGLWFVQSYTVVGRRIYATGFNESGARLAGIRTSRLRLASLIISGVVAGIAGVLLASQVSSGSPDIGPPYLLDAFAAAFLGATQFGGRFNAWGTIMAVLLLGTGKTGLVLVGAQPWAESMFSGVVLLAALALTNFERTLQARTWIRELRRRRGKRESEQAAPRLTAPGPVADGPGRQL
jgi:ribose transport system permease protein